MMQLLAIDDTHCKKELAGFMNKHKKSVKFLTSSREITSRLNNLMQQAENNTSRQKKLAVYTTESIILLNINDIIRCESHRNYTFIYLASKEKLIASKTLMDFEEVLTKHGFLRIHKSHLININYLERYVKSDGGYVLLNDSTKLPVAIRKKEYLFKELEKL